MDRLTFRYEGEYGLARISAKDYNHCSTATPQETIIGRAPERLADYEDTGLAPEQCHGLIADIGMARKEIEDLKSELAAYKQAEADGRLVRLPCRVGDTVFYLTGRNTAGRAGCNYNRVETSKARGFHYGGDRLQLQLDHNWVGNHGTYGVYCETVFLTREEAEAALAYQEGAL